MASDIRPPADTDVTDRFVEVGQIGFQHLQIHPQRGRWEFPDGLAEELAGGVCWRRIFHRRFDDYRTDWNLKGHCMARSRKLVGVLRNVLGAFISRYSDINGYWMLGVLVRELELQGVNSLRVELRPGRQHVGSRLMTAVAIRATSLLREQLNKAGMSSLNLESATLDISWPLDEVVGGVNGHVCTGRRVCCRLTAVRSPELIDQVEKCIFVAPHNPGTELRSSRATSESVSSESMN